jgi:DNA mismatch repair protein MutS2
VPEVLPAGSGTLTLVRARHPLLLFRDDVETVVPYDLELGDGERTLVVSGPNTGGKSVFLKAVGLLALLTQSGIVPPVGKGTALPVFTNVFADIGDEQSIAESLSTFSAHLENLKEIVAAADEGSLVLMDEMGTGTDPTEGAALARAIIESLTERRALSVVTSHLGALKTLAGDDTGIVNASLAFDAARMEPTYELLKGRPGRSYGLAIARRLGFDAGLLDRAEALVDEGAASLEELLERLETQEREARERAERTAALEAEVAGLKEELEARRRKLQERERTAEQRARDQARQLLMNARQQVEKAIEEVKSGAPEADDLDETARAARRRVEEAARRQKEKRPSSRSRPGRSGVPDGVAVGARVRLPGTGKTKGRVVELRDERATVEVGGLRMEVRAAELELVEGVPAEGGGRRAGRGEGGGQRPAAEVSGPGSGEAGGERSRERGWSGPLPDARHEVDLRGLRVDEVETELGRAVDAAIIGNLPELRIIHGKGTGAVRARVQELLKLDRRVEDFRLGLTGEGGSGVTVARLGGAA